MNSWYSTIPDIQLFPWRAKLELRFLARHELEFEPSSSKYYLLKLSLLTALLTFLAEENFSSLEYQIFNNILEMETLLL